MCKKTCASEKVNYTAQSIDVGWVSFFVAVSSSELTRFWFPGHRPLSDITQPEEASYGSSAQFTPFSQNLTLKTPKRQRKALIFHLYGDIVVDDLMTKGKCNKCGRQIQGKYGVTSNFVTHLKVCDCFKMSLCIMHNVVCSCRTVVIGALSTLLLH